MIWIISIISDREGFKLLADWLLTMWPDLFFKVLFSQAEKTTPPAEEWSSSAM